MKNLGMIVRMDDTGLGNQTKALCDMLKPDRIMVVDSTSFNGNTQHLDWYDGYEGIVTKGWPNEQECAKFMMNLTHLVTAETVYNNHVFWLARRYKTKVFIQPNWEFLDHLIRTYPEPYMWLMPSYWHLDDMKRKFRNTVYLPPPINLERYNHASYLNIGRVQPKKRFLHVVGKHATHDRNGTLDLLLALKQSTADYELVIKTQTEFDGIEGFKDDSRVTIDVSNTPDQTKLYEDFDAVIMPRRYAGLCLPMNEALSSSLPVIMPNIEPNNKVLPHNWLVEADKTAQFTARVLIDVYTCRAADLAAKIDEFANMTNTELYTEKEKAFEIAKREYSQETLLPKYKQVLGII